MDPRSQKMLEVCGCPSLWPGEEGGLHLKIQVLDKVETWTLRTKNGHLPTNYVWVSYRLKLWWPAIRYGLATLYPGHAPDPWTSPRASSSSPISRCCRFSLLGVNRNIRRAIPHSLEPLAELASSAFPLSR